MAELDLLGRFGRGVAQMGDPNFARDYMQELQNQKISQQLGGMQVSPELDPLRRMAMADPRLAPQFAQQMAEENDPLRKLQIAKVQLEMDKLRAGGGRKQFEPILDAQGNVIAQRDTTTGEVKVDPRTKILEEQKQREAQQAERQSSMQQKASIVTGKVDEALGILNRKEGLIDKAISSVLPGSSVSGLGGKIASYIPGRDAYELQKAVDTVIANLGFDELQKMRQASPTGGALGAVAVKELDMLQSVVASLDIGQDKETLINNLNQVRKHYENWQKAVSAAGGQALAPTAGPAPGTVEDGFVFKGGNPGDPNNWVKQ